MRIKGIILEFSVGKKVAKCPSKAIEEALKLTHKQLHHTHGDLTNTHKLLTTICSESRCLTVKLMLFLSTLPAKAWTLVFW